MINPSQNGFSDPLLDKVTAHLKKLLSSVTNLPWQSIDEHAPIEVFGVRAILQITNDLEKSLGWLSKTLYFEYSTLRALAQYFVQSYPEKLSSLLGGDIRQEPPDTLCEESSVDNGIPPDINQPRTRQEGSGEHIAIIGLSCRFPQARSMHEFWDNLRNGRDCIEEIPANRWDHRVYFDEERNKLGKTYGRWGGFVEGFDQFDPAFFNISPREAEMMDPQERVFLECVYSAVEDAGYTPVALSRNALTGMEQSVGVYVGLMFEEYNLFRGDILGSPASIANRVSYFCNFHGPSLTVDTMCSSSLTAIHLACQALKREECGLAIAGGVNLTLHPNKYLMLARLRMASPEGRCKAFGTESDGYVPGEGAGAVVLKSLSNALADGDHIYGIIQATAINQSGRTRSYFAPSPNAQADVIRQALKIAGINPRIVTYIETHGTGTSLGDPIEIAGLTKAFRKFTRDKQFCAVGSVKSNIGHCESAAGIAGLTKVLLQMKHGQLVPSLHSQQLNPNIHFEETPFLVQQKLEEWKRPQVEVDGSLRECPRIAGISSFGAGGANAHVVVEEFVEERRKGGKRAGRAAIVLSARNEERLREQAGQFVEAIKQGRLVEEDLWDMAYTLQVGREAMEHRLGMTAGTMAELAEKLKNYVEGVERIDELYRGEVTKNRDMAVAFKGDEDLAKALESWLKKGKCQKLLELWTKGVEIDWSHMYLDGEKPRRMSLPTYPFAAERYWVEAIGGEEGKERKEERERGRTVLHPLVQRNSSRLGEQRYGSRFSGEEFFLAEHMVSGNRMLPGVAYLEMARAAIEQAWPERPDSAVLELHNTVWEQPIVVSANKQVSIALLTNANAQVDYEISSQDGDQEVVHCQGRAVWSLEPPARLDLDQLKRQMTQGQVEPAMVYAAYARMGLVHGPAFQAITAIHKGSQQVLANLRLPTAAEDTWGDYLLHPSLMDGALQASAGLTSGSSQNSRRTRLPFALETLRVISPCTREMVAWVRYSPGSHAEDHVVKLDIDLCDARGNICVAMQGFSSRLLRSEERIPLHPQQEILHGLQSFVPVWNPIRLEARRKATLQGAARILLLGGDQTQLDWVQESRPSAYRLPLPSNSTTDIIEENLKNCSFDQLLWIAPDVGRADGRSKADGALVIAQQELGVLAVFRIVKALLRLGYGDRELQWTIITRRTQQVKNDDEIQPAHAAILGLVGSLAKEYPHWNLSLLDVDSLETVTASECLSLSPDRQNVSLAWRDGEWFHQGLAYVPMLPESAPTRYRQKGVYVVIGGAGGLGAEWTRFMIEHYQANVVWIGRQKCNATIEEKLNSLARLGHAPMYLAADATNVDALQRACNTILDTYPCIHGVVHSAIVLHDQSIARMEESEFRASLAAKVDVSVNIDRVFGRQELDFILFFSSIMSFAKSSGQSNYAAGCTFKDSFAQSLQQQRDYPVKIMNWGYWGNVGIVAGEQYRKSMERMGIGSIEPSKGMAFLETFVNSELSQIGLINVIDVQAIADVRFSERLTYYPKTSAPASPQVQEPLDEETSRQLAALEEGLQSKEMDALLAEILASSLESLGFFGGRIHRIADLLLDKQPAPFYERWLNSSIHYLQQQDLIGGDFRVDRELRTLADLWFEWEAKKSVWEASAGLQAHVALLETCLKELPGILSGKKLATDVIFPDSSMKLVEGIYRGNRVADYFNEVLGAKLSAWIEHRLQADGEHKIRILEIGAGTGGTTAKLLPLLQRLPIDAYCYTDVSRVFLMHAEERYQTQFPALTTAIFDVSKPIASQSIAANHYDLVIATNVLHATSNIRETLRNVKATLKNQGVLLINEISTWSLFTHLTFGLLEGWWLHEDTALRLPDSPGLAPEKWREILAEEGFESISFPTQQAHKFGQQLIIASSDGWVRQPLNQEPVVVLQPKPPAPAITTPPTERREQAATEVSLREKSVSYFQKLVASTLKLRPDQVEVRRPFAEYGLDSILVGQLTYQLRKVFSDVTGTLFFEIHSIDGLADYFLENKKQELVKVLSTIAAAPQQLAAGPPASQAAVTDGVGRLASGLPPSISMARESKTPAMTQVRLQQGAPAAPKSAAVIRPLDVAIIGLSGRYPGSKNLKEFWTNLSRGVNCITEIPSDRWNWERYYDPEKGKVGKIYTKWGGFVEGMDQFDPLFFKISPKEAKRMDPQERVFLEACYHAIEDAGYTPENLENPEKIGVFVGVMNSRYTPQPAHSSIANRVSYLFNFQGPSMAVDTACSSSLTAIHVALESIQSGSSTCAIAGGVNLIIDPVHYLQLAEMTMLSSGNQCKAFGEQADGLIDAEGVGAVVLKPLQQAQHDRDHIYGVIRGSAINAGGRTNGYTVPNPRAQSSLVTQALQRSNVTADQLTYVEAHGTGTALGDPIEIAGLTRAFRETSEKKQFCSIGSLKSNIGHCESAAGIAGLTKVLLQLKYQQLVPSLHSDVPNPEIDFTQTPFKVQKSLERWQRPLREVSGSVQEMPRIAGVSSFGAGGSNAHLIVQEYLPLDGVNKPAALVENTNVIIILSARSAEQLKQRAIDLLGFIREEKQSEIPSVDSIDLVAMAYTLQVGREAMEERLGLVVSSVQELTGKLEAYVGGEEGIEDLYQGQVKRNQEALSLFSTDFDLQQTLDKWIANRKMSKLLELWVKGLEVDWSKLYGEAKPQRISLPTYPFAKERYWVERAGVGRVAGVITAGTTAVLHPLVQHNTSDLSEQRYSSTFTGEEFFLADHQVSVEGQEGQKMLPSVAYLEMARAAIEQAVPVRPEAMVFELQHVVWAQPMLVKQKQQVSIALVAEENEQIDFEIYSQEADQEIIHCQGRGVWSGQGAPATLDVEQLKGQMEGQVEPRSVYAACARMGLAYGPSFQSITALHRGRQQLLAELRLPSTFEDGAESYVLHPSLMDGTLQACLGLMEGVLESSNQSLVPFRLDTMRLVSRCAAQMSAWVRYSQGSQSADKVVKLDIDLCDQQGNVCVQMRGLGWQQAFMEIAAPVFKPSKIPASPVAHKEPARATRMRKQVAFVPYQQGVPAPQKKPTAISLPTPSTVISAVSSANTARQPSAGRTPIALSSVTVDLSVEGAASSVRLSEDGEGVFSIDVAGSMSGDRSATDMMGRVLQALERVQQESSLKVLLLRGLERCFYGGREEFNEAVAQRFYEALVCFPCPVIAVLRADVIGAGFLAAALCDFMVASEDATYAYTDAQRHFYPTPAEEILLSERFGAVQAQDFLYVSTAARGRQLRAKGWTCPIVSGERVEGYAEQLASTLAAKSQNALGLLKRHLTRDLVELVKALRQVEIARPAIPAIEECSGNPAESIVFSAEHIHVETPADNVLVVNVGVANKPIGIKDLVKELGCVFARIQQRAGSRAIVLASELPNFLPETEPGLAEDVVRDLQRLMLRSEIPVVAALDGNAKGAAWLVSQFCDACVYSQSGVYAAAGIGPGAVAQIAAVLFTHRLGNSTGKEVVLTGAEYSGRDLEQRAGALQVTEQDQVLDRAVRLAESWAKLPGAVLAAWKKHSATVLEEKIGRLGAMTECEQEEEARGLPAAPTPIVLQSKVVTATAHPEGIAVVRMEDRQAKNMFSEAFREGVREVFTHLAQTPIYKVVILTGYESYFASGGTKEGLLAIQAGQAKFIDDKIFQVALDCKLPVIAAVQGHGIGAGWTLGMLADVVVLSEESRYVSPYMNYGFTPGAGATCILADTIGHDLARESLLTGQQYAGSELKERGLLLRVLPRAQVYEAAMALARQIAQAPRSHLLTLKQHWTGNVHERLQEVYRLELAMHEETFVGQSDTLAKIQENFYPAIESASAEVQKADVVTGKPCVDRDVVPAVTLLDRDLTASLKTLLADELQMSERDIDEHAQFTDLGLDSISGVTWVRKINEKYHTSIDATKVYSYPTLSQLSRYMRQEVEEQDRVIGLGGAAENDVPARSGRSPWSQQPRGRKTGRESLTSWRRRVRPLGMVASVGSDPATAGYSKTQPIAVIGMAGQFPQAKNLEEFWANLAQGRNCISPVAADRWDVNAYYEPGEIVAGKTNSQWVGALEEYDRFDPLFFNISPCEAESIDPQQRLFLQACWHSIESAGYDARQFSGSRCGVFAGCATGDYQQLSRQQRLSAQGFTGNATSILAARISYFLNLQGPCLSIDTACSSSLVALAHACDSLVSGASDLALAGGVYVMAGPELHIMTAQSGMLSPEGRCYTFDQRANGFVPGEGVGVVLLKRLAEAEKDQDIIYGVIQGWGINQDGKTNGITAPNPESQTRLEQEVYDKYQIDPANIQMVEAHGTGTKLGDPIEIEGLKKAFKKYTQNKEYCALGSVKSNIGHCATAAGIAGLIKLLLAVQHKQLPPTINFEQLNEHIELKDSPFYVNSRLQEWELKGGSRRQAAISSFGFSGTNAHVVMGEYVAPQTVKPAVRVVTQDTKIMVPLSARTAVQLKQKACDLWDFLRKKGPAVDLLELAYTLQVGREAMEERVGFLVSSVEQLEEKLEAYIEGRREIQDFYQGQAKRSKESISIISQDEEVREIVVGRWIAARKLSKLLELWVKGVDVDWSKLYGEAKPQRISLPVYPFAKERYWVDRGTDQPVAGAVTAGTTAVLHPLVQRNTSDLSEQRYSSTFTGDEFFLADHQVRVRGQAREKVLPGVAYLEMARAAIEQAVPVRPEGTVLELRNIFWLRPLIVTDDKQVSISVLANDSDDLEYEIFTIEAEHKTLHCQGQAVFTRQLSPGKFDIERLKEQMKHGRLESSIIYARFSQMGLNYGPAHQGITTIYLGNEQLLAQLRLPTVAEASRPAYVLHPSLMDSALQASIGLIVDLNRVSGKAFVPFVLESLHIISACTTEMLAWVRYAQGTTPEDETLKVDIDLCDQQGNVCVQMKGFSPRPLESETKSIHKGTNNSAIQETSEFTKDAPTFDSAFYQKLIADIVSQEVSVDEAVGLG
jgi:polyketide synthase PksM